MKFRNTIEMAVVGSVLGIAFLLVDLPANAQAGKSVWDGVYTEAQAQRGEPLYMTHCSACHGTNLDGGEMAPELQFGEFVWNYDGFPVATLYQRIRETMPLGNTSSASRAEKADILAYIMAKNNFPAGDSELSSRNSELRGINWKAMKP